VRRERESPCLLAGLAIATPLAAYPTQVSGLYASDLLGAGLGCLAAVAALTWLDGAAAIASCAAFFLAAGALYEMPRRASLGYVAAAVVVLACLPLAPRAFEFTPTLTKTMGERTQRGGANVYFTRWSPVNRVDLIGPTPSGGFWTSWGRSRRYDSRPPPSFSIVYDAHNGSDVFRIRGRRSLDVLDYHILSTPYLFHESPRVLVIGVGGGIDVLNALYHGASRVTGVDLQPITIDLHRGLLADWTGGWMQRPEVELVAGEGRHYVRSHDERYDILQITAVDTFAAQTTGAYVLAESYLYTAEAFDDYLSRLDDDGMLSIVVGDHFYNDPAIPSPFSTRLTLTGREALLRLGLDPDPRMLLVGQAVVRPDASPEEIVHGSWIQNLIIRKQPFLPEELAPLRDFARANDFTIRIAPDADADPHLARILRAPRAELDAVLDDQIFSVAPISDDRPFFFHVLRWRELVVDRRIEWSNPGSVTGQIVLLLMLGQALLLGGALVAIPLVRGARGNLPFGTTALLLLYFLGLGLGFLLIEISFVQKYVLLLGYPTYSLSVTIFSLLVFASLGAALSRRGWGHPRRLLLGLLGVTLALVALEVVLLPWVRERFLGTSLAVRIAVTVALQFPLGVTLGMYFPTGLELVRRREPRLVPWAWAVNGVASVVAAVLAVILGMVIGFSGVALLAAGIYAVGTLAMLRALQRDPVMAGDL
jgi:hypothetical protein